MRLNVTGRRPWPGPRWDGFGVALEGTERRGVYGLKDGKAVTTREQGRLVYLFGRPPRTVARSSVAT